MRRWHYIALDTHCHSTDMACVSVRGRITKKWSGPTTIPALVEALKSIRRPRALTFEEGPLADWLYRNLSRHVDDIVVCNPRRNALIAKESDKDDAIDAEKQAQLLRGGYLKAVHHPETLDRVLFKQTVGLYHHAVRHRVREANRFMGLLRRWGIFVQEKEFSKAAGRTQTLLRVPEYSVLRGNVASLLKIYDLAVAEEDRRVIKLARREEIIRKWEKLPGISWIRGATFFVYLDTPWRFKRKSQLWRYMGIGLEHRSSGKGPTAIHVSQQANHYLKCAVLGAAKTAIKVKENPFADQYLRWKETGLSVPNARRNVARSMASTLWGMWKSSDDYRGEWVGGVETSGGEKGLRGK